MTHTFFDRNQNLQINGDVIFFSSTSGPGENDYEDHLQVTQRVQTTYAHSRTLEQGLKILCENTAPSARYESDHHFTGPRCHPGTRVAVQDHIINWLDDENGPIAMWMNGPVGIGKSAIARSVADLAAVRMQLSSAFFFFQSDDARNSAKHLIATLTYEMTQQMPYTLKPICAAITGDPLIFSSPLERQIRTALLQPLANPLAASLRVHRLILIDGLDECIDHNTQRTIIRSFILGLLSVSADIIPHRILIVSRPEPHITSAFSAADISPHVKHLALESWDTEDDIGTFLRAKLDEIRQTHPLRHYLPDKWPADSSFRWLRRQSVGSFAFASVAIRYLASDNNSPERALQDILFLTTKRAAAAFADLDALYRHILINLNPETRFTLQKVLCSYLFTRYDTIDQLASFLSEDKVTIEIALIHARSLIQIYDDRKKIKFYHSSFQEFLLDRERSCDMYAFSPNIASAVAIALSHLWLRPTGDSFEMFSELFPPPFEHQDPQLCEMHVYIANALVATKIPTSFCYDSICGPGLYNGAVSRFFVFLQEKAQGRDTEPEHIHIYNQAFTVICDWLRALFDRFIKSAPVVTTLLNLLLTNSDDPLMRQHPFIFIFQDLTREDDESFYSLNRVFPEIDLLELYSDSLERHLAWHECNHNGCQYAPSSNVDQTEWTLEVLYNHVCNGVKLPGISHSLEKVVLDGMRSLGHASNIYLTPKDCIFRIYYGSDCHLDQDHQLAISGEKVSGLSRTTGWEQNNACLARFGNSVGQLLAEVNQCRWRAKIADQYIRQTHMEHDFPYISKSVEDLYCATSPAPE